MEEQEYDWVDLKGYLNYQICKEGLVRNRYSKRVHKLKYITARDMRFNLPTKLFVPILIISHFIDESVTEKSKVIYKDGDPDNLHYLNLDFEKRKSSISDISIKTINEILYDKNVRKLTYAELTEKYDIHLYALQSILKKFKTNHSML